MRQRGSCGKDSEGDGPNSSSKPILTHSLDASCPIALLVAPSVVSPAIAVPVAVSTRPSSVPISAFAVESSSNAIHCVTATVSGLEAGLVLGFGLFAVVRVVILGCGLMALGGEIMALAIAVPALAVIL